MGKFKLLIQTLLRRFKTKLALFFVVFCTTAIVVNNVTYRRRHYEGDNRLVDDYIADWKADDPRLISHIRKNYLITPAKYNQPYHLDNPNLEDWSQKGQSKAVDKILNSQRNGFFVEAGALDGEFWSSTLYFEKFLNWTGLLVEPDFANYKKLLTKNRKSWLIRCCIDGSSQPTKREILGGGAIGGFPDRFTFFQRLLTSFWQPLIEQTVWCFPMKSLLLAVDRSKIDYFALDIEGDELYVLESVKEQKIDINVIQVEYIVFKTSYFDKKASDKKKEELRTFFSTNMPQYKEMKTVLYDIIFAKNATGNSI